MFPYFYFVGYLFGIFSWLIIFITRKDLRRQILFIFNVPIEEILWFSTWGMISGPAHAFYQGAKFKSARDL